MQQLFILAVEDNGDYELREAKGLWPSTPVDVERNVFGSGPSVDAGSFLDPDDQRRFINKLGVI